MSRRSFKGKPKSKQNPFSKLKPQAPPSKGSKPITKSNRKSAIRKKASD